jgi:hypothetical protein
VQWQQASSLSSRVCQLELCWLQCLPKAWDAGCMPLSTSTQSRDSCVLYTVNEAAHTNSGHVGQLISHTIVSAALRTPKPCVARWCASCARSRPSVT